MAMVPDSQVGKPIDIPPGVIGDPEEDNSPIGSSDIDIEIQKPLDDEKSLGAAMEAEEPDEKNGPQKFDGNLCESLPDYELTSIGVELSRLVDEDITGRKEWEQEYAESVKYLGLKMDKSATVPFPGACTVIDPQMLEAIVRFQSRATPKLFPTSGPITIKVKNYKLQQGLDPQTQIAINKATEAFNDYVNENIPEAASEVDRMLFGLADIGFGCIKTIYSPQYGRPTISYTKAENFVLPYGFTSIHTCERYTEIVRRSRNEVEELIRQGYYIDTNLVGQESESLVEKAKNEITGVEPSSVNDEYLRFYEIYSDLEILGDEFKRPDGGTSPYVVTIEENTTKVVSIRRNWDQSDRLRKKITVHDTFCYVPAESPYGLGLVQLTGQLAKYSTILRRQLGDAGTLANMPSGFRSNRARITNPGGFMPGEFKEVQIDAADLQAAFRELPFKEPSQTLVKLLEINTDQQKGFSSMADLDISASSQNSPVGTTLALIERQTEVQNAVQVRLWKSMAAVFSTLLRILREKMMPKYAEIFGELEKLVGADGFTVLPVGDPTSATGAQRVLQYQAIGQMAVQMPGVFDMAALARATVTAMGLPDANLLVPAQDQAQPMGLVDEQMAFLASRPVKCFPFYNHQAHITAHMALKSDPMYQQILAQNPKASQILSAIEADIAQHLAFQYRNEIEQAMGVQLPPIGQPVDPRIDASLSELVAKAAQTVNQQHTAQSHAQAAAQQAADPVFQLQQADMQIKKFDVVKKHQLKERELQLREAEQNRRSDVEVLRINSQQKTAETQNEANLQKAIMIDDRQATEQAISIQNRLFDYAEGLLQNDGSFGPPANQDQSQDTQGIDPTNDPQ